MTQIRTGKRRAVVLLAEDNSADREIARRVLCTGAVECDLRTVNNGAEALDYLLQRNRFESRGASPRPDLLLLDVNMPRVSGMEVLRRVKDDPGLCRIPTLLLSTSDDAGLIDQAYGFGCNSYVIKPVDIPGFVEAFESIGVYWLRIVASPSGAGQ